MNPLEFSEWCKNNSISDYFDRMSSQARSEKVDVATIMSLVESIEKEAYLLGSYKDHPECDKYVDDSKYTLKLCYKRLKMMLC